jgi:hypothetical protein
LSKKKRKKKNNGASATEFVFRRTDNIGHADAHDDHEWLSECFVDTGELSVLSNLKDARRIVVGRTGSGKTALLEKLITEHPLHTVTINAEDLALGYVANSGVLRMLQELNVRLDPFFRLLWRHVVAVAILQRRFEMQVNDTRSVWNRLTDKFKNTAHRRAIDYIQTWGGDKFWQETQSRVQEITSKFENELQKNWSGEVNLKALSAKAGKHSTEKLSTEQKTEITNHGQRVVNEVHLKELTQVIEWIREILDDAQDYYYIVIDRLDENWVDEAIRYRLIRALIETSKDFQKASCCKIILAAREDLLARVYEKTADAGFQEEKYRTTHVNIRWTKKQLEEVIELRINSLLRRRYTQKELRLADVFPSRIDGEEAVDYILERTLLRPRDVIAFINLAIQNSDGNGKITVRAMKQAEDVYSRDRLSAIRDEWAGSYPDLSATWELLRSFRRVIELSDLINSRLDSFALGRAILPDQDSDIYRACKELCSKATTQLELCQVLVSIWYRIGVLGVKLAGNEPVLWSFRGDRVVSATELSFTTKLHIHKFAWRALGIIETASGTEARDMTSRNANASLVDDIAVSECTIPRRVHR